MKSAPEVLAYLCSKLNVSLEVQPLWGAIHESRGGAHSEGLRPLLVQAYGWARPGYDL
eukprot:CAMPEP_0179062626 /NCGR_PEP_ID=MMETSP0796-20121207/27022_1 /TAXON_ID=73915 /ORGANISM="Pyrodinium bahamense, Strain pbaha01" /LENGTH=57 /DNA_ID=CAMNT_0020759533 /DNA_START=378 /DNA_END=551 /DNA_ORIENTATION=+